MTDNQVHDLAVAGSSFVVHNGQRIPCAPSTSWGNSPSELEFKPSRFPLTRSTFVDSNGWPYHETIEFEVGPSIDPAIMKCLEV